MGIKCNKCGVINNDDAIFCSGCGDKLEPSNEVTEKLISDSSGETEVLPSKSNRFGPIFIIILITVLALSAIAFFFWFRFQNTQSVESPTILFEDSSIGPIAKIESDNDLNIYYTIDGSEPTKNSQSYSQGSSIQIVNGTTVKCIAINDEGKKSEVITAQYNDTNNEESSTDNTKNTSPNQANNYGSLQAIQVDSWPFNDQFMSTNFIANADSILSPDGDETYYASNLIDNNATTAWVENVSGLGIGETITLTYLGDENLQVDKIYFKNGYSKSDTTFSSYSYPVKLTLNTSNGDQSEITLLETPEAQVVNLPTPMTIKPDERITFTINSATTGPDDQKEDTSISEIRFD